MNARTVSAYLSDITAAAAEGANVVPATIEACRAGATLEQVTSATARGLGVPGGGR